MYGSASPDSARTATPGRRRRTIASPAKDAPGNGRRRNLVKVSRACDFCKVRKSKCNGMIPCDKCVTKGRMCLYDSKYSRGRPPTPPPSGAKVEIRALGLRSGVSRESSSCPSTAAVRSTGLSSSTCASLARMRARDAASREQPSRGSPELDMAEIQGQVFDPTSGVTFLHRAWKRLARQQINGGRLAAVPSSPSDQLSHDRQHWMLAGDKPLPQRGMPGTIVLPPREKTLGLLDLYFNVCIATYRFLHRGTTASWLASMERCIEAGGEAWGEVGKPRAAIVLTVLAIAEIHREKSCQGHPEPYGVSADELFGMATSLTDTETGFPSLESAQARLIHVLYLLTTSRMNRAWYTFGNVLQIIAALGLHRRPHGKRGAASSGGGGGDYVRAQCSVRTFWAAYILDQHLGVIFGRPRHFHDEDIDQEFPESVDDELMTPQGVIEKQDDYGGPESDCLIDALVFHARYVSPVLLPSPPGTQVPYALSGYQQFPGSPR